MHGSRNFHQGAGGPGQSDKKALTFFVFFSPQLILLKSNGSRGGPTFSRRGGGVQPFPGGGGGVQLLIPYRNPYNL